MTNESERVGYTVIDAIVSGDMIRAERAGDGHVIVWNGNAAEQIGEAVMRTDEIAALREAMSVAMAGHAATLLGAIYPILDALGIARDPQWQPEEVAERVRTALAAAEAKAARWQAVAGDMRRELQACAEAYEADPSGTSRRAYDAAVARHFGEASHGL